MENTFLNESKRKLKVALLVLISGFPLLNGYAQPYESLFGNNSTQWNITAGNLWGMDTDQHIVTGDTIINDLNYKIIEGYSYSNYKGFIREDVLTGKAWYTSKLNNEIYEEYLILDLSLDVGETFYIGGNWNSSPDHYTVDCVYINNGRKHIQFDLIIPPGPFKPAEKFTLIEGVTSNMGFRFQDQNYGNNFRPYLLCAFKDDERIYGEEGECTYTAVGLNKMIDKINLCIYPNPSSEQLIVEIKKDFKANSARLTDQTGITVAYLQVPSNNSFSIDLKDKRAGLYFLMIYDEQGNLAAREKVVVK